MSSLGVNGLIIDTLPTLIANLSAQLAAIYGSDINLNSNSPDGQLLNIFCQVVEDSLELLQSIYNSFGYQTAVGTQLDQRVAIMGVIRQAGTYTTTPVALSVSGALTLTGLDALISDPNAQVFTVQDTAGNKYQLQTTQTPGSAGTNSYIFVAVDIGPVQPILNTITSQVTTVLGVTGVNNPSLTATVVGQAEETDTQLKTRAAQSFALAATGPADAIQAALANVSGVTDASVIENDTGSPVGGVPAHSIWCIVENGADADIGQAIYSKKMPGCGMIGSNSYVVTRPQGTTFTALWDTPLFQPLYIKFGILWIGGVKLTDDTITAQLAAALVYKLNQSPNIGDVVTAMQEIAPTAILDFTGGGVSSDNSSFGSIVQPTTPQYVYTVVAVNITIS